MRLLDPDVLTAAHGLSAGASGFLLAIGLLLWACGWRWHRFWVVFSITLGAGVLGLSAGTATGGQVMVVGVLMAVAAGMLALEIARVLAFVTGGTAAWVAAQLVLPQAQELWALFLSGGLLGVALYRLWTMLATAFVGAVVAWHAGLAMAAAVNPPFDAVEWAAAHAAAVNGGVLVSAVLGVLIQAKTTAASRPLAKPADAKDKSKKKKDDGPPVLELTAEKPPKAKPDAGWLSRMLPGQKAA